MTNIIGSITLYCNYALVTAVKGNSATGGPAVLRWRAAVNPAEGADQVVLVGKSRSFRDHPLLYFRLDEQLLSPTYTQVHDVLGDRAAGLSLEQRVEVAP